MPLTTTAEHLFHQTLTTVDLPTRITKHVTHKSGVLQIQDRTYKLSDYPRIALIAIGKAAIAMSDSLIPILPRLEGIVVSNTLPEHPHPNLRYILGGHPVLTHASLEAADHILHLLSTLNPKDLVLFLISGGASAMVERPLDPTLSFEDTEELYRLLLHSGLPIAEMNCVRKHLSAVKGGRLAQAANGATQISLLVSDVPGDDLSVIGSGPSVPDPSTAQQCRELLHHLLADQTASPTLRHAVIEETPKPGDPIFARSQAVSVLSPQHLIEAAAARAADAGFHVEIDNTCDDWDCAAAADYLLGRLATLRTSHERVCLLSGGELSVRLPRNPGVGGRNQHFALACALRLHGTAQPTCVLSAGTDGLDGNSPAAGAVIDETTCTAALKLGLNPQRAYDHFDSYTLFSSLDAAIITGPTQNNLRDLRILLTEP